MARTYHVISADSHLDLSPEQWKHRVPDQWKHQAPKVVRLETGEDAIVNVIADLKAKNRYSGGQKLYNEHPMNLKEDFLRANRFYVTCQTSDDAPFLLKFGAQDSLMVGTDYSHDDQSGVLEALSFIEQLGEDGEMPVEAAKRILVDNPRVFYGL